MFTVAMTVSVQIIMFSNGASLFQALWMFFFWLQVDTEPKLDKPVL